MKLKNIIYFAAISLLILNILLLFKIKINNLENIKSYRLYSNNLSNNNNNENYEFVKYMYLNNIKFLNKPINLELKISRYNNKKVDTIQLKDIIKRNKTFLIFRYSYMDCQACVNKFFQFLNEKKECLKNVNVVLFTDDPNIEEVFETSRVTLKGYFEIFQTHGIITDIDSMHFPYLFTVSDGRTSNNIFIGQESHIDEVKDYLEAFKYVHSYE